MPRVISIVGLLHCAATALASSPRSSRPVAYTIAGSDSGGGAGIQADLLTFHDLGVHGCSAITALTAQNSHEVRMVEYPSAEMFRTTLGALRDDLPAQAIKLGMLGSRAVIREVADFLDAVDESQLDVAAVVCDPVMVTTSGARLLDEDAAALLKSAVFPRCVVVTPNLHEAEALLGEGRTLSTPLEVEQAGAELLAMGCRAVLIKGGHTNNGGGDGDGATAQDYFCDAAGASCWLSSPRLDSSNTHGTGCTLSSAIAALLARGLPLLDAITLGKAYVTNGIAEACQIGHGPGPVAHTGWPRHATAMPSLSRTAEWASSGAAPFARCAEGEMRGVLPVVDTVDLVAELAACGVEHIQLRVKGEHSPSDLQGIVDAAQAACLEHGGGGSSGCKLWVNDHWEAAVQAGAYGVHVGQEDLAAMSDDAIRSLAASGLRLGISTHSYAELATALALRPSYISLGPIYETTSKDVSKWGEQGLEKIEHWRQLVPEDIPLVAIGGITLERAGGVLQAGAEGIAVISAITKADDRAEAVRRWSREWW